MEEVPCVSTSNVKSCQIYMFKINILVASHLLPQAGEFDFRTTLGAGCLDSSFILHSLFVLSSVGKTPTRSVTCRSDDCHWGRIHDVWDNVAICGDGPDAV